MDKDNANVPGGERGTLPGEKRKGYIVNSELANKIDAIAFWDRIKIKDVINAALTDYVNKWVKKNGTVKPVRK
jgi:hypothetical protein